jgi:hypothetical protein
MNPAIGLIVLAFSSIGAASNEGFWGRLWQLFRQLAQRNQFQVEEYAEEVRNLVARRQRLMEEADSYEQLLVFARIKVNACKSLTPNEVSALLDLYRDYPAKSNWILLLRSL